MAMAHFLYTIALMVGLTMLLPCAAGAGGSNYEPTYPVRIAAVTTQVRSYYAEFRARHEAGGFGHSYVVLGTVSATGETRETVVAGYMPKSADDDHWGQFGIPVTGLVAVVRSDFTRRPDARLRITVSKARYYQVVSKVISLRRTWTTYELLIRNCNSFTGEVARAAGLRTPMLTAQLPVRYIEELRTLNSRNP